MRLLGTAERLLREPVSLFCSSRIQRQYNRREGMNDCRRGLGVIAGESVESIEATAVVSFFVS